LELLLELLLDNILIKVRICERVGSKEEEGIYSRYYRASKALNATHAFIA
jgi:hypothetical protein